MPVVRALTAGFAALTIAGCVNTESVRYGQVTATPGAYARVPAPLSVGEIVAELRAGRVQSDLAADIRERGLQAPARAADIDLLLEQGAGSEVIVAVRDESEEISRAARAAPGMLVAPAPAVVVPGYYGWYPWVPFSFGLWWHGGHHDRHPGPGIPSRRPPPSRAPTPFKPSR